MLLCLAHPLFLGHKVRVATAFWLGWGCGYVFTVICFWGEYTQQNQFCLLPGSQGRSLQGRWVYSFPVQSAEIYSSSTWGRTVTISPAPLLLCYLAWSWMTPSRSVSCHLWYSHWVGSQSHWLDLPIKPEGACSPWSTNTSMAHVSEPTKSHLRYLRDETTMQKSQFRSFLLEHPEKLTVLLGACKTTG